MSEPIWRYDPQDSRYRWAVTRWKLLHDCPVGSVDVEDEFAVEMGTPELVARAIDDAVAGNAVCDVTELVAQLKEDLERLKEEEP